MEIKKDKKLVVTGRSICFVAGIISAICGIYWLVQALFFDNTNLPLMLSSLVVALFLTTYSARKK